MNTHVAHTPGPWTADNEPYVWGANGRKIADCRFQGPQCLVNARLVSAAPELLAACQALPFGAFEDEDKVDAAQFVDNAHAFLTVMRLARAAINKATGADQ